MQAAGEHCTFEQGVMTHALHSGMSYFPTEAALRDTTLHRPSIDVAVVMRRESIDNRWQPTRWTLDSVIPAEPAFGTHPRMMTRVGEAQTWLHPGFKVELLTTDAEGYYLNVTTDRPCFWVVWRMEEVAALADEPVAVPTIVTLSYHDAGRWLDAQESVEQVPAAPEVVAWLTAFVNQHSIGEVKRRQRPQSFKSLQDRFGMPARVSSDKKFSGVDGG